MQRILNKSLHLETNQIFDSIVQLIEDTAYNTSNTTITEIHKNEYKRTVGKLWEEFCLLYLLSVKQFEAWLLKDTPLEILKELNLSSSDIGIDILARSQNKYYAIQCKFRSGNKKSLKGNPINRDGHNTTIPWSQLATFYGLVAKVAKFSGHWVMTNCSGISGKIKSLQDSRDKTLAYFTFKNLSRENFLSMLTDKGHSLIEESKEVNREVSKEEMRANTLKRFLVLKIEKNN